MKDKDANKQFEDMYEAVPIQPLSLEDMFHHVDCSVAYKEEDAVDGQVVLAPHKLEAFKDYVSRALEYHKAYDSDGAWYFLGKAEAMVRFECGIREGIFRAGQQKKASQDEVAAREAAKDAANQKKLDALVAHMEGIKGKWHNRDDFDFELKKHARSIDFTLGLKREGAVYADARITKLVAEIKPGARRAPGRST